MKNDEVVRSQKSYINSGHEIALHTFSHPHLNILDSMEVVREVVEWDDVYSFYGEMADEVKKLNTPDNVIDDVDKENLKNRWGDIRKIIHSVPTYEECETAMEKEGCKMSIADIGKDKKFFDDCIKYSPYMRRRLTLLRLYDMIM